MQLCSTLLFIAYAVWGSFPYGRWIIWWIRFNTCTWNNPVMIYKCYMYNKHTDCWKLIRHYILYTLCTWLIMIYNVGYCKPLYTLTDPLIMNHNKTFYTLSDPIDNGDQLHGQEIRVLGPWEWLDFFAWAIRMWHNVLQPDLVAEAGQGQMLV